MSRPPHTHRAIKGKTKVRHRALINKQTTTASQTVDAETKKRVARELGRKSRRTRNTLWEMYRPLANGEPVDKDGRFLHNAMSMAGELQSFPKYKDDISEIGQRMMVLKGRNQHSQTAIRVPKDYLKPQNAPNVQPGGGAIAPAMLAAYCVIVLVIGKLLGWSTTKPEA